MEIFLNILVFVVGFIVVALASSQIGDYFARIHLPLISGFLFVGVLTGPFVLKFIPAAALENLRFVDEVSLAFIAFAAGSELYLRELKSRAKSISWVTAGLVVATFTLGSTAVFLLADFVPFMRTMPIAGRAAVSLLVGAILVARSPSSAIAIVNELRAKGPFTQTVLGVTVIMDVIVILLFALNSEIADALLLNLGFSVGFILLLLVELTLSLAIGFALGKFITWILSLRMSGRLKAGVILSAGYGIFLLTGRLRMATHQALPFELLLEPLLICMVGGFIAANYGGYRAEFLKMLHDVGPPIYVAFFTLTGASLALDVLAETWLIALIIFGIRLVGVFAGSFSGGVLATDPMRYNRISWMAFVTQAGVGLGLAKEVAVEFPEWGNEFATMLIAVIMLSQIVGPPLFKWAVNHVGEAHTRAVTGPFDGVRDAIIFGLEGQSLALARQLQQHNWQVKIACLDNRPPAQTSEPGIAVYRGVPLTLAGLQQLEAEKAEVIVTMLDDEENYTVCSLAYEHFGTDTLVVRLNDRANLVRFHELGALIVEPSTAIVSLLDHLVRSPVGASLLLGLEEGQDVMDIEVCDESLDGVALRDLRLPLDTLVLSVCRDGHVLVSHGYTRLKIGDRVTLLGSPQSLEKVLLDFSRS